MTHSQELWLEINTTLPKVLPLGWCLPQQLTSGRWGCRCPRPLPLDSRSSHSLCPGQGWMNGCQIHRGIKRKGKKKQQKTNQQNQNATLSSWGSNFQLRDHMANLHMWRSGTPAGEVKNGAAHVRGRRAHPGPLPDKRDCWKAIDSFWQRQGEKYFDHVTLYKLTSLLHVWNFYRRYKHRVCNQPQKPARPPLLPRETSSASQRFCGLEIPLSG